MFSSRFGYRFRARFQRHNIVSTNMINTLRLFATRFGCCRYAFFHTPSPGSLKKGIRLFQGEPRPSPAGRSPQRGRAGEWVSNIIYEPESWFFNCLPPSPQPLSRYASNTCPRGRGARSSNCKQPLGCVYNSLIAAARP